MLNVFYDSLSTIFMLFFRASFYRADALDKNQDLEFERNKERFVFLKVKYFSF